MIAFNRRKKSAAAASNHYNCAGDFFLVYSFSPKDSDVDVLFYAYCNEVPVSRLKFTQTLFILNQYPLYSEFPANVFGAPVISPRISEIAFQKNQTVYTFCKSC